MNGWPRVTSEPHRAPPALGDLRGDGSAQLLLPGLGKVWAFTEDGGLLPGWPVFPDTAAAGLVVEASPLLADLDGDQQLDVLVASPSGGIHAFDGRGARLAGWPLPAGATTATSPVLADLEGDGDAELLTIDGAGWIYAFAVGVPLMEAPLPWTEAGGRGHANRATIPGTATTPPGAELLAGDRLIAYPNPTTGPVQIRYELGGSDAATIDVRILDATGRLIRELDTDATPGRLGELRWDGRDADGDPVPSGVYIMQLTARSAVRSQQHMRAIAVTR